MSRKIFEWCKIKDLDLHISDGNYSSKYPRADEFVSMGIPFIRANNLVNKTISPKDMYFITQEKHNLLLKGHIKTNDILITTRGNLGTTALVPESYNDANINAQIVLLRANPQTIDPKFLVWCFDTKEVQSQIEQLQTGTALKQLPVSKVLEIRIPLPPIAQQRRIAEILDRADAVRRKRREAIELTEELLRSAFLEMFSDPVTNPKGWEITTLANLLTDIESGWSPECDSRQAKSEEWGVLKLGAVTWGHFDPTQNKALLPDTSPRPALEVKVGDLLVARKNTYELVGASAFVHSTRSKLMLPDLIFRLHLTKEIDPVYLWQVLSQKTIRLKLSKLASGTSGSMPNISKARLRTLLLPLPPLEIQIRYREIVNQIWKQQEQQKNSFLVTSDLFNSLLQRAFRGEL
ncbi:MAG: restriction endonuclease subunit S [Phormidium sp.]